MQSSENNFISDREHSKSRKRSRREMKSQHRADHAPLSLVESASTETRWEGLANLVQHPCVMNEFCRIREFSRYIGFFELHLYFSDANEKVRVQVTFIGGSRLSPQIQKQMSIKRLRQRIKVVLEKFVYCSSKAILNEFRRHGPSHYPQSDTSSIYDETDSLRRADFITDDDFASACRSSNKVGTRERASFVREIVTKTFVNKFTGFLEILAAAIGTWRSAVSQPLSQGLPVRRHELSRGLFGFYKFLTHSDSLSSEMCRIISTIKFDVFAPQGSNGDVNIPLFTLFAMPFIWGRKSNVFDATSDALKNWTARGGGGDMSNLFIQVWGFLQWLMRTGQQAFIRRDPMYFFHSGESYAKWLDECIWCEDSIHRVGIDIEYPDYIARLDKCLCNSKSILQNMRASNHKMEFYVIKRVEALRSIQSCEKLYEEARKSKPAPFFISFYGTPRSGKTQFIAELLPWFFRVANLEFNSSMIYTHQAASKFADGLRSHHRAYIADDIATMSPDIAPQECVAELRSLMELANAVSAPTNQADIKDKGVIFARPEIVVVTSNKEDLGTSGGIMNNPAALLRRVRRRIHLHVKPEFRMMQDGRAVNMIDDSKVEGHTDIHLFSVYEWNMREPAGAEEARRSAKVNGTTGPVDQDNAKVTITSDLAVFDGIKMSQVTAEVFFKWLHREVVNHRRQASNVAKDSQKHDKAAFCDVHLQLVTRCGCKEFEPQGNCATTLTRRATRFAMNTEIRYHVKAARQELYRFGQRFVNWGSFLPDVCGALKNQPWILSIALQTVATMGVCRMLMGVDKPPATTMVPQDGKYQMYLDSMAKGTSNPWDVANRNSRLVLSPVALSSTQESLTRLCKKQSVTLVNTGGNVGALALGNGYYLTVSHFYRDRKILPTDLWRGGTMLIKDIEMQIVHVNLDLDTMLLRSPFVYGKDILQYVPRKWEVSPIEANIVHDTNKWCAKDLPLRPTPWANTNTNGKTVITLADQTIRGNGACGAIAIGKHLNNGFIAGMHIAGVRPGLRFAEEIVNKSVLVPLTLSAIFGDAVDSLWRLHTAPVLHPAQNGLGQTKDKKFARIVHPKSHIAYLEKNTNWIEPDHVEVLGSIDYGSSHFRTRFIETPLKRHLGVESTKVPPVFKEGVENGEWKSPWKSAHDKLFDNQSTIGGEEMWRAVRTVFRRKGKVVSQYDRGHPLREKESLNGVDGVRFMDAIKVNTGRGLPLNGPKAHLVTETATGRFYNADGRRSVEDVLRSLVAHDNRGIHFNTTFKDEVKKPSKAIRTFTSVPAAFNDIMRRLCLPIFKILQENWLLTGMAIGIDCRSKQWGLIMAKHLRFLFHVFWDFKSFDASHNVELMNGANWIWFRLMMIHFVFDGTIEGIPWYVIAASGFSFSACPVYLLRKTLIWLKGTLASGLFYTAQQNSFIQEIIIQMLWYEFFPEGVAYDEPDGPAPDDYDWRAHFQSEKPEYTFRDSFTEHCVSDRLGDDGMLSTSKKGFDLPFFIRTAKEKWNLTITSPTKDDNCPESFPLPEWNFLKRGFRPVETPRGSVCFAPLEMQSIYKSLCYYIPDKECTEYQSMIERAGSAGLELAFHGSQEAEDFYDVLQDSFTKVYGVPIDRKRHLPSLEELRDRYWEASYNKPTHSSDALCVRANMDPVEFATTFHSA